MSNESRLPTLHRLGELERYGFLALLAALLLGLAFLYEELRRDRAPEVAAQLLSQKQETSVSRRLKDALAWATLREEPGGGEKPADAIELVAERGNFNFFESPVKLPGRAAPYVPPTDARVVRIRKGDTLSAIAARHLGAEAEYRRLLAVNPGLNPNHLVPGETLRLPPARPVGRSQAPTLKVEQRNQPSASRQTTESKSEPSEAGVILYVVKKGDTLQRISSHFYGTTNRWREIYRANRSLKNENDIDIGDELRIPQ